MPIYEYECQQGHRFEQRQGFHDAPLQACNECGQPVRRLLSPAGIIFKGSGWYITDSRASSNGASNGSKEPSSDSSAGESKSETKAEAKSEVKSTAA